MSSAKYADKFEVCSRQTAQEWVFIPCYLHFFREEQARPVRIGLRTQPRSRVSLSRVRVTAAPDERYELALGPGGGLTLWVTKLYGPSAILFLYPYNRHPPVSNTNRPI